MKSSLFCTFWVFLMTSLLLVGSTVTSAKESIRYYERVSYGKNYAFIGIDRISNDDFANHRAYYEMILNDEGNPTKIRYMRSGELAVDDFFEAAIVVIEYTDKKEKRRFYDVNKKPKRMRNGVFSMTLLLNEAGHRDTRIMENENGEATKDRHGIAQYKWKVDDEGYRIETTFYDDKGKRISDSRGTYLTKLKLDENGHVMEESFFDQDGTRFCHRVRKGSGSYIYTNASGKKSEEMCF